MGNQKKNFARFARKIVPPHFQNRCAALEYKTMLVTLMLWSIGFLLNASTIKDLKNHNRSQLVLKTSEDEKVVSCLSKAA